MDKERFFELENKVLLNTYARPDFVITHGRGCYLYDNEEKEYLDFVSGIAVCAFGHADQQSQKVLTQQAAKLWHCSNLYHTTPQVHLAEYFVSNTFADKVFFCNSGTEAMEAVIKFARKWACEKKGKDNYEIVSMNRSFHGRTFGALSSTGQESLKEGFEPMLPGFVFADFNDLESVQSKITEKTCAILVEPVQGEGGIYPAGEFFITGLRKICDDNNLLLLFDEIQCGFGRTGTFCAYEQYGIVPDVIGVAKPIAGGLPLGAVLLTDDVAQFIKPGNHGTTFGGGPLVTSVALDIMKRINQPSFLQEIREKGSYFIKRLENLKNIFPEILAVRGKGLMLAIELSIEPKKLIDRCAEQGLLICKTGGSAVRFLPPLSVSIEQIDEALNKLNAALIKIGKEKNGETSKN